MSSSAPSRKIHRFSLTVSLTASLNGNSGLSAIAAQTKNQKSAARSTRYLTRSHSASGFRVGRSSSRGRLVNCGPEGGGEGGGISLFLPGPRIDDLVDRVLLPFVARRAATDSQEVDLLRPGVDDRHLVDGDGQLVRRKCELEREAQPVEPSVASELVEPERHELPAGLGEVVDGN